MPFGFIQVCGTENTIFILSALHEKYLAKKEYVLCICDLEKVFTYLPRNVVWWALKKADIKKEWLVEIVQSMGMRKVILELMTL